MKTGGLFPSFSATLYRSVFHCIHSFHCINRLSEMSRKKRSIIGIYRNKEKDWVNWRTLLKTKPIDNNSQIEYFRRSLYRKIQRTTVRLVLCWAFSPTSHHKVWHNMDYKRELWDSASLERAVGPSLPTADSRVTDVSAVDVGRCQTALVVLIVPIGRSFDSDMRVIGRNRLEGDPDCSCAPLINGCLDR